ncbi:phosphatase PAP2 family protein [Streptomyces sp. WMMC500]|uniref:phosphatase PAP2 family protein n=1 Tax=Streptomyces sp. WMMC500 TaxID=3015154 RepID=UPI00248B574E|nr:phosphatase PAP2 family protein [Streptomyces sp. WMMC500]WBB61716.1 phosphatase PAP2 family protein [Streptomyces sp. WMMC500]
MRLRTGRTARGRPGPGVLLHPSLRAWLGPVAVLATLVVAVLGILVAGDGGDGAVDLWLGPAEAGAGPWRDVALAVDFWGEPAGAAALVVGAVTGCLALRRPRAAVLFVAGTGAAVAATTLLKPLVGRTIHGDNLSYPSGHTAFVTACALVLAMLATGRPGVGRTACAAVVLGAALVAGAAMGWAQVALGAHHPTDVVGGWCTAAAVIPATAWLIDRGADAGRRRRR